MLAEASTITSVSFSADELTSADEEEDVAADEDVPVLSTEDANGKYMDVLHEYAASKISACFLRALSTSNKLSSITILLVFLFSITLNFSRASFFFSRASAWSLLYSLYAFLILFARQGSTGLYRRSGRWKCWTARELHCEGWLREKQNDKSSDLGCVQNNRSPRLLIDLPGFHRANT